MGVVFGTGSGVVLLKAALYVICRQTRLVLLLLVSARCLHDSANFGLLPTESEQPTSSNILTDSSTKQVTCSPFSVYGTHEERTRGRVQGVYATFAGHQRCRTHHSRQCCCCCRLNHGRSCVTAVKSCRERTRFLVLSFLLVTRRRARCGDAPLCRYKAAAE